MCAAGPTFSYRLAWRPFLEPISAKKSRTYIPTRTIQLLYVTQRITSYHGSERFDHRPPERVAVGSGVSHNPRRARKRNILAGATEGDRIREETGEGRCLEKQPATATFALSAAFYLHLRNTNKTPLKKITAPLQDLSGVGEGFAREQQQAGPGQVTHSFYLILCLSLASREA